MPLTNMLMSVFTTGKFFFTVVEMKGFHLFKTNQLVELFPNVVVSSFVTQVVSGRKHVACISTDANEIRVLTLIDHFRELFKVPAKVGPLTGCGFQ